MRRLHVLLLRFSLLLFGLMSFCLVMLLRRCMLLCLTVMMMGRQMIT